MITWHVASIRGKDVEQLGTIKADDALAALDEARRRWPHAGDWSVTREPITVEDRCWAMARAEVGRFAPARLVAPLAEAHLTGNPYRGERGEINKESPETGRQLAKKWRKNGYG